MVRMPPLAMGLLADLTKPEPAPLLQQRVTPLEFLQQIYHSEEVPLNVRLRAAIECAPYCHPKLSATLLIPEGGSFAERLERAVKRSQTGRVIEHQPTPSPGLRRI